MWHRGAYLRRRFEDLLRTADPDALAAHDVGEVALRLFALRAASRRTQHRLSGDERLGAETSVDKVLLATTEQAVFDLAAAGIGDRIVAGDDPVSARWRSDFLYSRAATIYGGTSEIQRNVLARRVLGLGEER